jgi:hypothetical protein
VRIFCSCCLSSTNAEDLDGFNGAGLYESVPVHDTSAKEKARPARNVASHKPFPPGRGCYREGLGQCLVLAVRALATFVCSSSAARATRERDIFGFPRNAIGMSILVQPYLSATIVANGRSAVDTSKLLECLSL